MLALRRANGRVSFSVRVTTRASANTIGGVRDGALLVRVTAPPAEGAANRAVVSVLAKALDIAPSSVRLERGAAARDKVLSVPEEAEARLSRVVK